MSRGQTRRQFLVSTTLAAGGLALRAGLLLAAEQGGTGVPRPSLLTAADLPTGGAPAPVDCPHFPDRLHAFVWRNWALVPLERMARVVGARPGDLRQLGRAMGLPAPPRIRRELERRTALTVIKRNWHLLPYEQLLELLDWAPEQLAFTLREDDFLYVKLGNLKPRCAALRYVAPDEAARRREREMARLVAREFPDGLGVSAPLFKFVAGLSAPPTRSRGALQPLRSSFSPRFCHSYFALCGDPLLDPDSDPYPEGYLARLAAVGVDGIWLPAVLSKLAPFPWDLRLSVQHETRLRNLRSLVRRAREHGLGVYLYLNEPRALPLAFYASHPDMKGVVEEDYATLCTSCPEVRAYLADALATIGSAVPELAGLFTITASENLTHCWSHHHGERCPRCGARRPAAVVAELIATFQEGLRRAGAATRLIVWDWGWPDDWAEPIIGALGSDAAFMSVSEWSMPIRRGGIESTVGEYCISAVGPGPRARRHWGLARRRGLKTIAKIQAGNTWELSAVPYIPAVENVAQHAANLRAEGIDGLMLGWTLGGYPSPNLEVVAEIGSGPALVPLTAMERVAGRRFGAALAPAVVRAWQKFSRVFSEYPFGTGLYVAPLQLGPANLLWAKPTGYAATMVGFPYDDLSGWCGNYPPDVFIRQLTRVADGFDEALAELRAATAGLRATRAERSAFAGELSVAEAAAIHFRSAANQCRFVVVRRALENARAAAAAPGQDRAIEEILREEIALARRLHALQIRDTRLGFEASNQYYYVPLDLAEKVLNCYDLLARGLTGGEPRSPGARLGHSAAD